MNVPKDAPEILLVEDNLVREIGVYWLMVNEPPILG